MSMNLMKRKTLEDDPFDQAEENLEETLPDIKILYGTRQPISGQLFYPSSEISASGSEKRSLLPRHITRSLFRPKINRNSFKKRRAAKAFTTFEEIVKKIKKHQNDYLLNK
jgi:hypothetical protein